MISRLFEEQVRRSPDRVAVGGSGSLTYAELNRLANRIAAAILRARGRREEPVALLLEKDASFIAAFLGVLKAGKICVPLDPSYPDARNRFVLEDTEAAVVVTHDVLAARVPTIAPSAVVPVNVDALDSDGGDGDPDVAPSDDALATILYTSGSRRCRDCAACIRRRCVHSRTTPGTSGSRPTSLPGRHQVPRPPTCNGAFGSFFPRT